MTDSRPPVDESDDRDAGISLQSRKIVQSDREDLLVTLDGLHRRAPGDVFIVGQLVRFLVDARRLDDAFRAATRCTADAFWCALLRGYALAVRGQPASADSAFGLATQLLPPVSRCEWTDIGSLLREQERQEYRARSCASRDSLAMQYWWLARPLLSDMPGPHLRRVEHYRRKVLALLHASLPFDELHDMRPSYGGDAVTEMLVRYGWPTVTAWGGDSVDREHDGYLLALKKSRARPYTTAEYSPGRVQFGTALSAVRDPFRSDTLAWELRPPPSKNEGRSGYDTWQPVEHMRFPGATVTQLSAGQTAFFRRPASLRFLAALETGAALQGARDETPLATLVASTAPDSMSVLAESPVSSSGRVELVAETSARPMLLGIESIGTPSHPLTARTRFGTVPPLPLDSLPPGEIAISTLVFFDANAAAQPRDLEALSRTMLGTTTVNEGGKVGLFWETYGVAASDSVRYAVEVKRMETVGLFQRIGALLRIIQLPVSSISLSWQDARSAAANAPIPAKTPTVSIAAGSVVLDAASLSRGSYMIEVSVAVRGRADVRTGRMLTIR